MSTQISIVVLALWAMVTCVAIFGDAFLALLLGAFGFILTGYLAEIDSRKENKE